MSESPPPEEEAQLIRGFGHYLWPPQWIASPPLRAITGPAVAKVGDLSDLVLEADLGEGWRARCYRDGLVTFAPPVRLHLPGDDFMVWQSRVVRLINALSACLQSSMAAPGIVWSAVANIWNTFNVNFETGDFMSAGFGTSGGVQVELWLAREQPVLPGDWRLRRGPLNAIPIDAMRDALDLLARLLRCPYAAGQGDIVQRPALLRAELLQRARSALVDLDYTSALISAWTATEGMLGVLMNRYLDRAEKAHAADNNGGTRPFLNRDRRGFFNSANWTIRHTAEVLSLVDDLPFSLYEDVKACAKARNKWMHSETTPSNEDANLALRLGGEIFGLVYGIPMTMYGKPRPR